LVWFWYWPASHSTHADCPKAGWAWPTGHGLHAVASIEAEKEPGGHRVHSVAPVRLEYDPAGQDWQVACVPLAEVNLPIGHSRHISLPEDGW
jgi:hypothetical protein